MLLFSAKMKLANYIAGYCAEKGIPDTPLGILSILSMKGLLDEKAVKERLAAIDEKEPEWLDDTELKEGTYKIWCTRRNSSGAVIKRFVCDTDYVRQAWAIKYARNVFGMSRPAFEWTVSIECPWKLEMTMEGEK